MTLRNPQRNLSQPASRSNQRAERDRLRKKREKRHSLLETLENRQLLAGPDLIGIQPNEGSLLFDNTTLSVSPRELVFRFDDNADIDPDSLSSIRITRAGDDAVFESATATSDMASDGEVLLEFRAIQPGSLGNGIEVEFTTTDRAGSSLPDISVDGKQVTIDLNSNPNRVTRVRDLVTAVANHPEASTLLEVIQVSGPSLGDIGSRDVDGRVLTLTGANAAQAVTDFNTAGEVTVRLVSQLPGVDGRGIEIQVERRNFGAQANPVVVVNDQTIRIQLNSAPTVETTAEDLIAAINGNREASQLVLAYHEQGDIETRIGNREVTYSPLSLSGVSDVVVEPGFVGLGDSSREVVFRFAEPLPDDIYQIDILGTGPFALRNVDGELFQDGEDLTRVFNINLGPQVVAVVPEPIRRNSTTGALSPETGKVEVHFNDDDLDPTLAEDPSFYQLIFTGDTVSNVDDAVINPASVDYNNITNIATLDFERPLSRIPIAGNPTQFYEGAARLRIGTSENLPSPPTEVSLIQDPNNPIEPGDSFGTAFDLNTQWTIGSNTTQSARLTSEIFNETAFELDLPGPDAAGTRDIRPDDPSRLNRTVPLDYLRNGADVVDGISIIQYNFAPSWLGDDPNRPGILEDTTYFNIISEQQKTRVREVLQLYSQYLGISFVEVEGEPTSDAFISIAVGDLYGGDETATSGAGGLAVVTRDRDGDGIDDLGVMDFQDFDESTDDQFGGEFFRGAMFVVGQLLGYGYADDLPQPVTQSTSFIFAPGTDNEPAFPSVADIVHGQYLYRPDSTDIDLYKFTLDSPGRLAIETLAERLGDPSLLNTTLRLYQENPDGSFTEIAQNDNYFSNDSLIDIDVLAGNYVVGVSARGNDDYDPNIVGSGFGGLTEGEYELRLDFRPTITTAITDTTGVPMDGDGDNRPGGIFDFWFVPNDANNTLYVDKAAGPFVNGQTQDLVPDGQVLAPAFSLFGQVGNPYNEIDDALARAAAQPGFTTIRIVGNGGIDNRVETVQDNFSYQIGFDNNGLPLDDGSTMDLPQGVRVIIDSGAVLKFSGSRIGVGSVSPEIDLSDSALQILGLPSIITPSGLPARDATNAIIPGSVYLTSFNDDTIGAGNSPVFTPTAGAGDWGGIDFRGDLDTADESRRNRELEGVFLNHIQNADIRFGGGSVSIGGQQVVVSPIDMAITRPTIINSRITLSADAAIAATPDTFEETRFTSTEFQAAEIFTPDYTRVGPNIFGNTVADNSFNGLFVRVATRTGEFLEPITTAARFDDTDIPHIVPENLVVRGTPGGPILQSSAPSSLLVRLTTSVVGDIDPGTYVYRLTNVDVDGLESAASQPTVSATLGATGGIVLNQLPLVPNGSNFVSRRLYRAPVDPGTGLPGEFRLVAQLNASSSTHVDREAEGTLALSDDDVVLRSRLDGRLSIDPGTVVKLKGSRIEARFGATLIAEGAPGRPIIFTSLDDQRYGGGGTFDTNGRGQSGQLTPGDWGGIYIGHGSSASIDNAVIAGGGGTTRIEGGFASFNALEVHQADLRLANTTFDQNADGRVDPNGTRVGRGDNATGTLFARASQPIIVGNDFADGDGPAMTFDINSLNALDVSDYGRATGRLDAVDVIGNSGPLIEDNSLTNNSINGLEVRGGELATEGVWDDVNIVHVVRDTIEVPNKHIFGGLRLQSDARGSLVVKFEDTNGDTAGIVVGGSLATAADQLRDIPDRIGGSLQLAGHPDFPVVLTTLADDFAGAGFTREGLPQVDTNNDGVIAGALSEQRLNASPGGSIGVGGPSFPVLPAGNEINRGNIIDNDVSTVEPGYFEATPGDGNEILASGVTVEDLTLGQLLINQNYIFAYRTYIETNGAVINLSASTITQPATLIADDVVESRGTFVGPNGTVTWVATSQFLDGVPVLFTGLELFADVGAELGDVRVISYLDEDVEGPSDDVLIVEGTPGQADFRALTIDSVRRVGFSHGGFYVEDGANLINATYAGWSADQFNDLEQAIIGGGAPFTVPGTIDLGDLPPDPNNPLQFGPNDVTTAFAWDTLSTANAATITSFLELIPADPEVIDRAGFNAIEPGLWNGVVVREAADDRNVAAIPEQEPVRTSVFNTNSIPSQSQFLGEIAPDLASGDENRRLGFIVDGALTQRNDIDVYSFIGESNTEVWLDIDRTSNSLDTVVELIDANGRVLASSNDSILAETDPNALFINTGINPEAARPLSVVPERLPVQDITVSESIVEATGELAVSIPGANDAIAVPVDTFLANPAEAIANALNLNYGADLGVVEATLLRRTPRQVDANDPNVIVRDGEDFVIRLRFDEDRFVGRSAPTVNVDTSAVLGAVVDASTAQTLTGAQIQDEFSTNPKDAGMRIQLPGEAGTRNLYHVRVRSANTQDPLDFATLNDPDRLQDGLSRGRYELQIRLQEADESPGTQVRLSDIRYATNGLQIIGQPFHSPLLGDEHETSADNDSLANAQPLGYFSVGEDATVSEAGPLQSDRLSKAFAGEISSATDVDWYRFEVTYENLTRDAAALHLSTVFDLDYASNFARSDMALYVFNAAGELILVGGDSNVADDLPGITDGNDTADLSRGSAGTEDPYIGATELAEGTYFVAVANQSQVPLPLDQFFNPNSANPLLRLEPIDSVQRIAEDRIGSTGGGTATGPTTPVLFDGDSIIEYSFDDTLLYVNTANGLLLVNPFTGQTYGTVGNFGLSGGELIRDIAFRANGELFAYSGYQNGIPGDANWFYRQISTEDGSAGAPISVGAGMTTHHDLVGDLILEANSDDGFIVEGIAIREFTNPLQQSDEVGFFIGSRPFERFGNFGALEYIRNVLYDFDDATGLSTGPVYDLDEQFPGAGTSRREVGQINTVAPQVGTATQLGITDATVINAAGIAVPSLVDGDRFTLTNLSETVTFEFDQGFTLLADGANPVRDGDAVFVNLGSGEVPFEFNTGERLVVDEAAPLGALNQGDRLTIEGVDGQTATFEFVRLDPATTGNIAIATVLPDGQAIPSDQIAANLAAAINANLFGLDAISNVNEVFFTGARPAQLTTSAGAGVTIEGDNTLLNAGAIGIDVSEDIAPELLIARLAAAMRGAGIPVSAKGTQLALPTASSVRVSPDPVTDPDIAPLTLSGTPGVTGSNVPILLLPTDTVDIIAQRITTAVQAEDDAGNLPDVAAIPDGHSLRITNGIISQATGNLVAGGVSPNIGNGDIPIVTGIELINSQLYAVTNRGGMFVVNASELDSNGNRQVGQYVRTATDLVGINFTGLRAGPVSVEDGSLQNLLFGITGNGDIYAFNTRGELQPVFAGNRSVISTGIAGAQGLDFSTMDFNLWHVTGQRGADPGHGINALHHGARPGSEGGNSLAFSYEASAFNGNYPSVVERPTFSPRVDGQGVEDTFNNPGGSKGVVQSNPFSLVGFGSDDQPTMYFNYFAENDGDNDRLRVYVITENGVEHLVASNTTRRGITDSDDEFDDPAQAGVYNDEIDVDVQQLFDNTGSWRQARIPLDEFAGEEGLMIRVEYSTGGSTNSSSDSVRALPGDLLVEGEQLVINGEAFTIDLAPTVTVPSGVELDQLFQDPNALATINIDGQAYTFNDGTRQIPPGHVEIDLLANVGIGITLSDLTADQVAVSLAEAVRLNPPTNPTISGVSFSDPSDDPNGLDQRNDLIFEATELPYDGTGNLTINGSGRVGSIDEFGVQTNLDDVDLLRVNVARGTTVGINATFDNVGALEPVIRFFDALGDEVNPVVNITTGMLQYTATVDGPIFIGISGTLNDNYDPRVPGSAVIGQTDSYTASIAINQPVSVMSDSNIVEVSGLTQIVATPSNLFSTSAQGNIEGLPIRVSRFMTADEVAAQAQHVIATRFTGGVLEKIPTSGSSIRLPGLQLDDSGPFANEADRYGELFGGGPLSGVADNNFEGIYLDDFIIGFAERGEIATDSNVVDQPFTTDLSPQFPVPADPTSNLLTGAYQVEIRDGSEYIDSLANTPFRTFDTNERMTESRTIVARSADQIRDGQTFSINDGRSTVTFEFDLVESGTGVTPGNVRIPFTLQALEPGSEQIDPITGEIVPGSGTIRPQTAPEVAQTIVDSINREDVQLVIEVPALRRSGVDGSTDATINLFADVLIEDATDALADVQRNSLRGDDNRERESQGIILVENSRFLFNENFGLDISHDVNAVVDGVTTPSAVRYARNLVELNTESLKPGVVVQSNVFSFNGTGGLQVSGFDPNLQESGNDPVPFERIVNNTFIGGSVQPGTTSPAATFEGILFEHGQLSFADAIASYLPDAGGAAPTLVHQTPDSALGAPDGVGRGPEPIDGTTEVSLGIRGSITVQFTDNLLTGSGDARPDLAIFETGAVESVRVEVSRDGLSFFEVGIIGGLTALLDIDAAGFDQQDRFAFVRLTDVGQGGNAGASLGADIDAVGALSTVPVDIFTPGGNAITINGNAAPALLNNVIANSDTGLAVDPNNDVANLVLGGNSYYRNTNDVSQGVPLGEFSQILADSESVFTAPAQLVFAPSAGASIIDSSIDSLEDRPSLTTVKNPLGLPPSPILAPRLDVNGQLRVDDPNVETPSGLGERVFKDRGASDRGDLEGPRAVLLSPMAPNIGTDAGVVSVFGDAPAFFEIQLIDGIAPADVTPGTGLDDQTVLSSSILLLKDNVALVEGIDYRFGYNPSTNVIRLTPIAGVWETDSTYLIRMIDDTDAIIAASEGVSYTDATRVNIVDQAGESTPFEYDTGVTISFSESLNGQFADGITLDIFDGAALVEFELDNTGDSDPDRIAIEIPEIGTADEIAQAVRDAIASIPALNLDVNVSGNVVQLQGTNSLAFAETNNQFVTIEGQVGTSIGYGIQIPADGARPDASIDDGDTFIVRRGAIQEVLFEIDVDGFLENDNAVAVGIPFNATLDDIADAIVRAVGGAGLGLSPENVGEGRVFIGGDITYSMDLTGSTLTQIGVPGDDPTVAIPVNIDESADLVARAIAQSIDDAALPGVLTTVVDTRVFVEGTGGVSGVGAVELVTISDEVGNQLQSNQPNGRTELVIFIGGGFDYGDAPAPYVTTDFDGGPRHRVDSTFAIGSVVSPESDAIIPDGDDGDGITHDALNRGFLANFDVRITNTDLARSVFYLDAWFDWNGDGEFEQVQRFGSAAARALPGGNSLGLLDNTGALIGVNVPDDAALGEVYARFRLSEQANLGPVGDASSGEVEDVRLVINNNPFQNPDLRHDVNNSGFVSAIDALQIINAITRFQNNGNPNAFGIDLADPPLPPNLPAFPDVDGNSMVTINDASQVITELGRLNNIVSTPSPELITGFVEATGGVFASSATVVGDVLINEALAENDQPEDEVSTIDGEQEDQVSVFDHPAVQALDSVVDAIAEDTANASDDDETSALDQLFASL